MGFLNVCSHRVAAVNGDVILEVDMGLLHALACHFDNLVEQFVFPARSNADLAGKIRDSTGVRIGRLLLGGKQIALHLAQLVHRVRAYVVDRDLFNCLSCHCRIIICAE